MQKENAKKEIKKNRNIKYRKNKKRFVPSKKYPIQVSYAFRNNQKCCELFMKILTEFSQGRHLLDKSPLDIYELKNGLNARKRALDNILGLEHATTLDILLLNSRDIYGLADVAYEMLYKGLEKKLDELDLNCYISAEKVVNAGNAIKNYDGIITFGGATIRDFLNHTIEKEKISAKAEESRYQCENAALNFINNTGTYKVIKSIPFSIFRYKDYIKTNEKGEIIKPDIEAKSHIRRIVGNEIYENAGFKKITMKDATTIEIQLIEHIKSIVEDQLKEILKKYIESIPESVIKEHLIASKNIDAIALISNKGLIHDIVDIFDENIKSVVELEKDPYRVLNQTERKALFQIEYTSIRSQGSASLTSDNIWIAEIADAINAEYAKYAMIKTIIEQGFVPKYNEADITAYDIDAQEFCMIMADAKKNDNPIEFIENSLKILLG